MKDGVGLLNLSRGGIVNEEELLKSINSGKISFAGIDTFENEPVPSMKLLMNSNISESSITYIVPNVIIRIHVIVNTISVIVSIYFNL